MEGSKFHSRVRSEETLESFHHLKEAGGGGGGIFFKTVSSVSG